jgi:hypothetical protein
MNDDWTPVLWMAPIQAYAKHMGRAAGGTLIVPCLGSHRGSMIHRSRSGLYADRREQKTVGRRYRMDENTGFTGSKPSMNYVLAIAAQFNAQTPSRSRRRPEAERQPVLSMS